MESLSLKLQNLKMDLEKSDLIFDKLKKQDIYVSSFFNLSNDLLTVAGSDGYFRIVNNTWTEVLGYSSDELTSSQWIDFVHPDDVEKTLVLGASLAESPCYNFINRYLSKKGHYVTLSWNARQTADGTIYACARVI